MIGRKFGRWTVIGRANPDSLPSHARWNCRCECGTERIVLGWNLKNGSSKSCGCGQRDGMRQRHSMRRDKLIGQRFGKLLVLRQTENRKLLCRCDCGNEVEYSATVLRKKRSCGCILPRHGNASPGKRTPTYISWIAMRQRCYDPNSTTYPNYGGRGITICERWNSFKNFLSDMGERPPGKVLTRIDQDGNYGPDNCIWGTRTPRKGRKSGRERDHGPGSSTLSRSANNNEPVRGEARGSDRGESAILLGQAPSST